MCFDFNSFSICVYAASVAAGCIAVECTAFNGQLHCRSASIIGIKPDTAAITSCCVSGDLCKCSCQRTNIRIDSAPCTTGGRIAADITVCNGQTGAFYISTLIDTAAVGLSCIIGNGGTDSLVAAVSPGFAGADRDCLCKGIETAACRA